MEHLLLKTFLFLDIRRIGWNGIGLLSRQESATAGETSKMTATDISKIRGSHLDRFGQRTFMSRKMSEFIFCIIEL